MLLKCHFQPFRKYYLLPFETGIIHFVHFALATVPFGRILQWFNTNTNVFNVSGPSPHIKHFFFFWSSTVCTLLPVSPFILYPWMSHRDIPLSSATPVCREQLTGYTAEPSSFQRQKDQSHLLGLIEKHLVTLALITPCYILFFALK